MRPLAVPFEQDNRTFRLEALDLRNEFVDHERGLPAAV
jgi:hypothetical protein